MGIVLITFLGRAPRDEKGYRTTTYRFPDGSPTQSVAFLGWALVQRLRPQRVVVLGTVGSMWDHLFERDTTLEAGEAQRLALIEAVQRQEATQSQLDAMAPLLNDAWGCQVCLRIIPYARDLGEQAGILQAMAEQVNQQDCVHLDVTHGFRHLPMLALLSALHLQLVRKARIEGIWYGSFDPDTGDAPVLDLSGLLRIADAIQTFARFEKDGDYGILEPLLRSAGLAEHSCENLRKAAYYENTLNLTAATGELRRARSALKTAQLAPEGALLLPAIDERLAWLDGESQSEKQIRLARLALERRDYLRATLYAFEAVITAVCRIHGVRIEDFDARDAKRREYEETLKAAACRKDKDDYFLLKNLRNQLAHGTRGTVGEVQRTLLDEPSMRRALDRIIGKIERKEMPDPVLIQPDQNG
ncbi:CRISPR-associated protein, TM1812 family [Fontimonas thermophila]|uniref:CRISPR-associated protein, TM1812 family n=1 Tax=Fontimonas thermophila TaxID=1076937 RepID=A0A1I2J0G5_9GAMM|nr:TIGR02221 family CRISPR-associated protein [Fontimonas thermophila]SFF47490.1 CRISPR-associated protein, TM1812 family [Fontimonas thermophila]